MLIKKNWNLKQKQDKFILNIVAMIQRLKIRISNIL